MAEKKSFTKFGLTKSRMEKVLRCPFSYDCHYNKKIRPIKMGSALMFGVSIDEALNELVKDNEVDAMEVYRQKISEYKLGSIDVSKYDYDKYLISYEAEAKALKFVKTLGYKGDSITDLFNELWDKGDERNKKHDIAIDYLARVSLEAKAEIMLQAYKEQVLHRIKKVHAVQKESEAGIVDLIIDWDKKGNKVIADNKTASMEYDEKEAEYSVQLSLYSIQEKIDNILYIVIPKKIEKDFIKICKTCGTKAEGSHRTCNKVNKETNKRCHGEFKTDVKKYVTIQFVEGKVTEEMKLRSKEIQEGVQKIIDIKAFVCNFANCSNQFGKPCQYRDLYWKGDMKGLEDQSKKGK